MNIPAEIRTVPLEKAVVQEHIEESISASKTISGISQVIAVSITSAVLSGLIAVAPVVQDSLTLALPVWATPLVVAGVSTLIAGLSALAKHNAKNAVGVALYSKTPPLSNPADRQ